jgi:hypothetical protein
MHPAQASPLELIVSSSSAATRRPSVRSPPKRRPTCPRVRTPRRSDRGAHLTRVSTLSGPGTSPVSGQLAGTASGRASHPVPVSCCLSAAGVRFSGHPVPARELGLPHGRLTGRTTPGPGRGFHVPHLRDTTGVVPSLPRGRRCSPGRMPYPAVACRFPAASPCTPHLHPTGEAPFYEASTRVHAIHPSGLPLTCGPPDGTAGPWAFPCAPHPAVTGSARQGRAGR